MKDRYLILVGLGIVASTTLAGILYKKEFNSNQKTQNEIITYSIYNAKKDSLENAYKIQLDSLNADYQTKLKKLESKFK